MVVAALGASAVLRVPPPPSPTAPLRPQAPADPAQANKQFKAQQGYVAELQSSIKTRTGDLPAVASRPKVSAAQGVESTNTHMPGAAACPPAAGRAAPCILTHSSTCVTTAGGVLRQVDHPHPQPQRLQADRGPCPPRLGAHARARGARQGRGPGARPRRALGACASVYPPGGTPHHQPEGLGLCATHTRLVLLLGLLYFCLIQQEL